MDDLARELELRETIAACDAMNNARVELEEAAGESERWREIRRYVFPLLEAERKRLEDAVQSMRAVE
jgi:hypothetical protein